MATKKETSSPLVKTDGSVQVAVDNNQKSPKKAEDLRKLRTFTGEDNLNFQLQKKGEELDQSSIVNKFAGAFTGRTVVRDWNIDPEDLLHMNQKKSKKAAKVYNAPHSFIAETKVREFYYSLSNFFQAEYLKKAQLATTKQEKSRLKPWNSSSTVDKEYRIIFSRKQKLGKEQSQDTYLYFSTKEEVYIILILSINCQKYEKMRNYLKAITLLETNQFEGTKPNDVLFRFSLVFKCQMIMKVRKAIHEKARNILKVYILSKHEAKSFLSRDWSAGTTS